MELLGELPLSFVVIAVVGLGLTAFSLGRTIYQDSKSTIANVQKLREAGQDRDVLLGEFPEDVNPSHDAPDRGSGFVDERLEVASDGLELGRFGPEIMKRVAIIGAVALLVCIVAYRMLFQGNSPVVALIALAILFVRLGPVATKKLLEVGALKRRS